MNRNSDAAPAQAGLEFRGVSYDAPGSPSKRILRGVSFAVFAGEHLTILGPSGSGKSTLLRLANRLIEPTVGEILLNGAPVAELPPSELRRRVGLVHQKPTFIRDLSLRENLLYGVHCRRKPDDAADEQLAAELLERVGLPREILEQDAEKLSGGEAQRLCLARTLATEPEALLLDEPTSSLDPAAKGEIEELIAALRAAHDMLTILVTHDLEQARRLGGRGGLLIAGELQTAAAIEKLLDHPALAWENNAK